jgi:hypothetical protein
LASVLLGIAQMSLASLMPLPDESQILCVCAMVAPPAGHPGRRRRNPTWTGSAILKIRGARGEHAGLSGWLALALAERVVPGERPPLLRKAMRGARYLLSWPASWAVRAAPSYARAETWMSDQGVRNVARLAYTILPGLRQTQRTPA